MFAVITKVFPDEYHLHTLDLLLSNIARLNPHVDMKKIVIGLMDRLSSYAVRDAEIMGDPAKRKEKEEDAVARLLGKLQVSEEKQPAGDAAQENGTKPENAQAAEETVKPSEPTPATNGAKPGIPDDIKLYEIFYEQVVNLIKTRGLPIQDTIALLVSLVNLAL